MKKLKFIFGVHCHQPIGNMDFVFSNAFYNSYLPFINFLLENPHFKSVLHYSGVLLQWMENNSKDILYKIYELIDRNQVEILSGGYYEPIMSNISENDRISQVKKLSEYLNRIFGVIPEGMWIAERVWEENYPSFIKKSNLKYTVLDDYHFKSAGFYQEQLNGYFVTEDLNNPIFVFPIDMNLRYLIPFGNIDEIIVYLEKIYENYTNPVVIFMDDGEKFGEWPGTYETVYKNKWLENLSKAMLSRKNIFEFSTFSEILKELKPSGTAYIPANSYKEMVEWSLPYKKHAQYLKLKNDLFKMGISVEMENFFKPDGYWRNFFVKYPESNIMHKRMIYERRRHKLICSYEESSNWKSELEDSLECIHKSQSGDAYWHGKYGGIYYPHLRDNVYKNIIKASRIIDKIEFGDKNFIEIFQNDFDCDGIKEVFINSKYHNLIFKPESGGRLISWEDKNLCINIANTISRKRESYHDDIIKNHPEISNQFYFDWYLKNCFIDHFLFNDLNINDFYKNKFNELGDFVINEFSPKVFVNKNIKELSLSRTGNVYIDSVSFKVDVEKKFIFNRKIDNSRIDCKYSVYSHQNKNFYLYNGIELNLFFTSLPNIVTENINKKLVNSIEIPDSKILKIQDFTKGFEVVLNSNSGCRFWIIPNYSVICSRTGYEKIFQGITLVIISNFSMTSDSVLKKNFSVEVNKIDEELK